MRLLFSLFSARQHRTEVHSGSHTLTSGIETFKIVFFRLFIRFYAPRYYLTCFQNLEFVHFFFLHSLFSIDILALANCERPKVSFGQSAKIVRKWNSICSIEIDRFWYENSPKSNSLIWFINESIIIIVGQWTWTTKKPSSKSATQCDYNDHFSTAFTAVWYQCSAVFKCAIVYYQNALIAYFHRLFWYSNYQKREWKREFSFNLFWTLINYSYLLSNNNKQTNALHSEIGIKLSFKMI